jgi:hypothetical protein
MLVYITKETFNLIDSGDVIDHFAKLNVREARIFNIIGKKNKQLKSSVTAELKKA